MTRRNRRPAFLRRGRDMSIENFENIVSLLCTIIGLLYCIFQYIETPKPGFRCLVGFFLANFLSEYYRTVYQLVMGAYPDVSAFAAYLGWNVGYLLLLLAVLRMRRDGEKQLLHPVMLLPVLTNIPQLLLYIRYGGVLNNLWEVGLSTLVVALCLRELVLYRKTGEDSAAFPWFPLLVFVNMVFQYGMWTASCLTWPGELANPYFYCSVLSSLTCLFFGYGAKRFYAGQGAVQESRRASEQRFQVLVQTITAFVVIGICAGGFFAVTGMKRSLPHHTGFFQNEKQIVVFLFALSAVLILLVLALLYFLTAQYRHAMEIIRKMQERKRSRINFIVTVVVTLALMVFTAVYNNMILHHASVVSVYEEGDEAIATTATELENYLTVATTTLRVAADSVDLMVQNGSSTQDVTNFIVAQTAKQSQQFDENFTGIYAYINGTYLDGLNWVPPEGYEPTQRDWYRTAAAANGQVVIVSPYLDAQTGSVVITIGKAISDTPSSAAGGSKNVVCLDVIVNHIQEVTQAVDVAGKGYGMVVNGDGFIVAHRDRAYNGLNLAALCGPDLLEDILQAKSGRIAATIDGEACTLFLSPVMNQWYAVIVIRDSELFDETRSQLAVNMMVSLITFCLISFFYYIGYRNEQISGKKVEEMNLQVVSALAAAIDAKDVYTKGHSARVAEYARMIAARSGYSKAEQDEIYLMGLLHDVGKIGIPDEVINKPSRLTEEEYRLIQKHPVIGNSILSSIRESPKLATGARWHHERYGGGGYPDGISGEQIPEEARIIAVADAYDAMTSRRSYRDVMPRDKVRSEIEKGMGTQFDPKFARVMLRMMDEDPEYTMRER